MIAEHPQFFTATILEWKHLLRPDKYKGIIVESLRFLVNKRELLPTPAVRGTASLFVDGGVWDIVPQSTKRAWSTHCQLNGSFIGMEKKGPRSLERGPFFFGLNH